MLWTGRCVVDVYACAVLIHAGITPACVRDVVNARAWWTLHISSLLCRTFTNYCKLYYSIRDFVESVCISLGHFLPNSQGEEGFMYG